MFAAKVDGVSGNGTGPPVIGGSYNSGPNPAANREPPGVSLEPPGGVRERKLSSGSGGANTVGMKSKWVKAFKSIKGGKEEPDRYLIFPILNPNHTLCQNTYFCSKIVLRPNTFGQLI